MKSIVQALHDDLGGTIALSKTKLQTRRAQILKAHDHIYMVAKRERKRIEGDGARREQRSASHG